MSITSLAPRDTNLTKPGTPDTVGPGNYEYRSCFTPPKKSRIPFGSTTRRDVWNIPDGYEGIGPGTYNNDTMKRPPTCLADFKLESRRIYFVDNEQKPGPADHGIVYQWGQQRLRTGLSNRPRMRTHNPPPPQPKPEQPGPGSYNLMYDSIDMQHACAFSASRSPQREPARYNGVPGPGAYGTIGEVENRPPSPAFRSKDKRKPFMNPVNDATMQNHVAWMPELFKERPFGGNADRDLNWGAAGRDSPGPAAHSVVDKKTFKKQVNPFGSDRVTYPESYIKNPGPGTYEKDEKPVVKSKSKLPSFGKSKRPELWGSNPETPGPSEYDPYSEEQIERSAVVRTPSPAFKDRSKRYEFMVPKQQNPGPGGYFAEKPPKKHVSKFNKDVRFREDNFCGPFSMNDSPSPANYTVETPLTRKRIPGGAKMNSSRFEKGPKNRKVGPGSYGIVGCEMLKPSFNVKFDPELKKKTELRKIY